MIGATIVKDVRLLLRDKGTLASMFLLPLVFIAVFGVIFGNAGGGDDGKGGAGPKPVEVGLWIGNEPRAPAAAAEKELAGSELLRVRRLESEADADRLVASKEIAGALILPADYAPDQGRPAVLVLDDAAPDQERYAVQAPVVGLLTKAKYAPFLAMLPESARESKPVVSTRTAAGLKKKREYADAFQVTVPSNVVLFIFFTCVAVGLSFCEERKSGTWRRMLAAPVSRQSILLAKLVPFFVIGLLQVALLFAIGVAVFGMDVSGSYSALVAVTVTLVFCAVGLGFLVASFGGSEKQIGSVTSIVVLVMGMISGCMVPRAFLPDFLKSASLLVPHAWALDAYRDVLVREGVTVADVLPALGALAGFGAAFSLLGARLFRFER